MRTLKHILLFVFVFPLLVFGQVQKLSDPNPDSTTLSSGLQELTEFQGTLYAYANVEDQQGLWRLDSISNQMEIVVKDLVIYSMVASDDLLFMLAETKEMDGPSLWKSDGTSAGTVLLPGIDPGIIRDLEVIANRAYFTLTTFGSSNELWITDGTLQGTQFLHDIYRCCWNQIRSELVYSDAKVFFFGINAMNEIGIYETDGSPSGTIERYRRPEWTPFQDVPHNLVAVDSMVYFLDREGFEDGFLYQLRPDTVVQMHEVSELHFQPNYLPFQVQAYEGNHYFIGNLPLAIDDSLALMRTDGSLNHLETVQTFADADWDLALYALPQGLVVIMKRYGGQAELMIYDGTSITNSIMLPGLEHAAREIAILDSILIFESSLNQFWRTDGTVAGTYSLANIAIKHDYLGRFDGVELGDYLYLAADSFPSDRELYRTDGSTLGLFQDIETTPVSANMFKIELMPNDHFLFSAYNDSNGQELWISDGTSAGTELFMNIHADSFAIEGLRHGSNPLGIAPAGNLLYFLASDNAWNVPFPYVTDGTPAGTRRIADIWRAQDSYFFKNIREYYQIYWQDKLYFTGVDDAIGSYPNNELFQYDPIGDTAILLKEIEPTIVGSFPRQFTATDNFLYFMAETMDEGRELWRTDGTTAGTILVKDIEPGQGGAFQRNSLPSITSFVGLDSIILFTADEWSTGWQLWRSNGTANGTFPLQDSLGRRALGRLHRMGNNIIFAEKNVSRGPELWISDGTDAGTELLLSSTPGSLSSNPTILYVDEDIAFFTLENSLGIELWKSDGTVAGTQLVKDMVPGSRSSCPSDIVRIDSGKYLLWAEDGFGDRVLWFTDGTWPGTYRVTNYLPSGAGIVRENRPVLSNGFLYFFGEDVQSGQSLFRFDLGTTGLLESEPQSESTFQVYPNPADDRITVRLSDATPMNVSDIKLLSPHGQVVQQFAVPEANRTEFELNLSESLPQGYYIVALQSDKGQQFVKLLIR